MEQRSTRQEGYHFSLILLHSNFIIISLGMLLKMRISAFSYVQIPSLLKSKLEENGIPIPPKFSKFQTKLLTFYAQNAYLKRPCFCKCGIENRVKNLSCVYVCIYHLKITHAYDKNERRNIYDFVEHPPMFIILPIQLCMKQTDMNVP